MVDRVEQFAGSIVISTALKGKRTLPGGGEQIIRADGKHDGGIEEAGPTEAGECENDGIELAAAELLQAGVDVAANRFNGEIGTGGEQLAATPEAAGADAGGGLEVVYGPGGERDEYIPGIFPLGDGGGDQVSLIDQRHGDRDVFEAVDGEIDFISEEGLIEFLGEQALPAGFVQRAIGDAVAGGFDRDKINLEAGMEPPQLSGDEIALSEGKQAGA